MNQPAVIQDMVIVYAVAAVWLLAIWTKGMTMQPTPAAQELLDAAAADYADPRSVRQRESLTRCAVEAERNRLAEAAAARVFHRRRARHAGPDNCGLDIMQDIPAS